MIKLLIVDDELAICDFLSRFFKEKDYQIFTANNGKSALAIVKSKKPNIVLLDIKMPGTTGLQVLQQIKELNKDIKVVMMTAVRDETMVDLAKQYGASDYITKPFSLNHLENEVMPKLIKQLL